MIVVQLIQPLQFCSMPFRTSAYPPRRTRSAQIHFPHRIPFKFLSAIIGRSLPGLHRHLSNISREPYFDAVALAQTRTTPVFLGACAMHSPKSRSTSTFASLSHSPQQSQVLVEIWRPRAERHFLKSKSRCDQRPADCGTASQEVIYHRRVKISRWVSFSSPFFQQ